MNNQHDINNDLKKSFIILLVIWGLFVAGWTITRGETSFNSSITSAETGR